MRREESFVDGRQQDETRWCRKEARVGEPEQGRRRAAQDLVAVAEGAVEW